MPKLPVITSPSVAPQPINLPGPRRTYAGEGASALGGALMGAAVAVDKVTDKWEAEADEAILDPIVADATTKTIEWRVGGPKQAYKNWVSPDQTKLGARTEYNDRLTKFVNDRAAKLTPEQRQKLDARLRPLKVRWDAELLEHESKAVTEEAVQGAARVLDTKVGEAASLVIAFQRDDYGTPAFDRTMAVLSTGPDSDEFKQSVERLVQAQGLYGVQADEARRRAAEDYHLLISQSLLANKEIPKAAAKLHVDNLIAQSKLNPKNPKVRDLVSKVTEESVKARVEEAAQTAVVAAKDGGMEVAKAAWQATKQPGEDALTVQVEGRIEAMYSQGADDAYLYDTKIGGLLYKLLLMGDRYNVENLDDPTLTVDGKSYKDLRSNKARVELQRSLREARATTDKRKGVPDEIESPQGEALWRLFKTLPSSQKAALVDMGHPLYDNVKPAEIAVIARRAMEDEKFSNDAVSKEVKLVAAEIAEVVRNNPKIPEASRLASGQVGTFVRDFLRTRYAQSGKLTAKDFADVRLEALLNVDTRGSDTPQFLVKGRKPRSEGDPDREEFFPEGYRESAAAAAKMSAGSLSPVFGTTTSVLIGPSGERRVKAPGQAVPTGWREIQLRGSGKISFDDEGP